MNILIDVVPDTVLIDEIEYEIYTDFRISMLFELLMQDESLLDNEKIDIALNLYYPDIPHDLTKAVDKMLWFYRCGIESQEKEEKNNSNNKKADGIYSFEHDDEYIYAAFLDQYNIDLQDIDSLHWWKFRALFKSLKDDNLISKVMGFRAIAIDSDMSDNEKKYYRKMKQIYALPDLRTQDEKETDFDNAMSSII